jgi:hypothetical protein
MLSGKLDVLNTEQLQNKPGFHKSLSTGDGGGRTTVVNHQYFFFKIVVSSIFTIFN